ncbi:hypothetical protein CsSME_00022949 [Camellia sinensis var. sinensis]
MVLNLQQVVANFSASWCDPCRVITPFYSELSEKYSVLMFLSIDVDKLTEFSTTWDVKAIPAFFFFQNGQQVEKLVQANKPDLQACGTAIVNLVATSKK